MICKLILIGLVASASLALGSPTKGRYELTATKSERQLASPIEYAQRRQELVVEQQRELSKTRLDDEQKRVELAPAKGALSEQRKEPEPLASQEAERKEERREEQRRDELLGQQREELSQVREEAPVQVAQQREEPAPLVQQKEELAPPTKSHYEARPQVREEAPLKQEQQRETQYEQQQQQVEYTEQNRYEEQQQFQYQQQQELEPTEQRATKGGAAAAPVPETEPYAFDYSVEGSSRRETGDTRGVVRGQYTLSGPDGSRRVVDYVADRDGFRAAVNTNEFGTESRGPANVQLRSSQPAAEDISLRLEGKTREFLNPPPAPAVKGPVEQVPARPENWNYKGGERPLAQYEQTNAAYYEEAQRAELIRAPGAVKGAEEAPRLEYARPQAPPLPPAKGYEYAPAKGYEAAPTAQKAIEQAPVKEVSRLESIELPAQAPASSKGEELKASEPKGQSAELKGPASAELKANEQQQRAELAKSAAEARKPKSIDLYAASVPSVSSSSSSSIGSRVTATAHRPIVHVPVVRGPHQVVRHLVHQQVAPVRHYSPAHHSVVRAPAYVAPVRSYYREVQPVVQPIVHHQHHPITPGRVVSRVHEHIGPRGQSHPRVASYSTIVSEEEAPIGFEASRS